MITAVLLWTFGIGTSQLTNAQQIRSSAGSVPVVSMEVDRTAEFNVKAVYLYNFARSIEWPAHEGLSDGAFRIGVLGKSGIIKPLQKLAKFRKVVDKRTGVQRKIELSQFSTLEECRPCHILFVAENVVPQGAELLRQRFEFQPVLIVGETTSFATRGGTAEFLLLNGGVQFDLNLQETKAKKLKLDAKLLKAANRIIDQSVVKSVSQN